jgi:anti-sigma B factor antagonist
VDGRLVLAEVDPPIVTFPAEIDVTNADQAAADLAAVCVRGTGAIVADLTRTTFSDSSAVRALVQSHLLAASLDIELDVAVTSPAVLRILELTGLTSVLHLHPSIEAAVCASPRLRARSDAGPAA